MAARRSTRVVWLADWTDREQEDFDGAMARLGTCVRVIRSRPTGQTVGTRWHRLNSYPAYVSLALRALVARPDVVIAWQPIVGALLAYVPGRPRIIAIEPVIVRNDRRLVGRFLRRSLKRVERVVMSSSGLAEHLKHAGFATDRVAVVPRGIVSRHKRNGAGDSYFLAGGREHRDWLSLREAAAATSLPIKLGAPNAPADGGHLRLLPTLSQTDYIEQLRRSRALIVPLKDNRRGAGLLSILEAYSHGVPVIASRNIATEDYVVDGAGVLVDPGDVEGLKRAIADYSDPNVAAAASAAASRVLETTFSLDRFLSAVHTIAEDVGTRAMRGRIVGRRSRLFTRQPS